MSLTIKLENIKLAERPNPYVERKTLDFESSAERFNQRVAATD